MQSEKKYTTSDVSRILNVKEYEIVYLFRSGRLNKQDFPLLAGRRLYSENDIDIIRNALADVAYKS